MSHLRRIYTVAALICILATTACAQAPPTGIRGAGAPSASDLMSSWANAFWYESAGLIDLKYDGVGSIEGFNRLSDSISSNPNLTMALRDYPVSNADKANLELEYGKRILHVPIALEGIAVAFNLPAGSIPEGQRLRLTRNIVARIYAGEITKWNHEELLIYNPFLSTLDIDISPVGRSDKCGTSFAFTSWLSHASTAAMAPSDQPVFGPAVTSYSYNRGVAQAIISELGSIGYLTYGFAVAQSEGVALLENQPDSFVEPNIETITEATSQLTTTPPKGSEPWEYISLVNVPGPNVYPITNILFIVVMEDLSQASFRGPATVGFLRWINTVEGQQYAQAAHFIPITEVMRAANEETFANIQLGSGLSASLYWPPPPNAVKPAPTTGPVDPTVTFKPFDGYKASPPRDYSASDVTVSDFSYIFMVLVFILFVVLFVADNFHSGWIGFPERRGWCEAPQEDISDQEKFEAELTRLQREQDAARGQV